jgi:hypothetical protein
MAYDSSIISYTTKTDKVDLVQAAHINAVQSELVTIETILGTGVKGDRTDLKTRLNNALDADGSILSGNAYPSPALPSQMFYASNNVMYVRNLANTAWATLSSATNVQLFTTSGAGTFVAPTGITKVYLTMIGGGGGGGNSGGTNAGGGGGGGAGGFIINYPYTVVAGNSYSLSVGVGGGADTNGSASTFDSGAISVPGGTKGDPAVGNGGLGAGGLDAGALVTTVTRTGNDVLSMKGGNGAKGGAIGASDSGGAGGNSPFGIGGDGGVRDGAAGVAGATNSGAGGGGAPEHTGGGGISAGSGATGFILVAY